MKSFIRLVALALLVLAVLCAGAEAIMPLPPPSSGAARGVDNPGSPSGDYQVRMAPGPPGR